MEGNVENFKTFVYLCTKTLTATSGITYLWRMTWIGVGCFPGG